MAVLWNKTLVNRRPSSSCLCCIEIAFYHNTTTYQMRRKNATHVNCEIQMPQKRVFKLSATLALGVCSLKRYMSEISLLVRRLHTPLRFHNSLLPTRVRCLCDHVRRAYIIWAWSPALCDSCIEQLSKALRLITILESISQLVKRKALDAQKTISFSSEDLTFNLHTQADAFKWLN